MGFDLLKDHRKMTKLAAIVIFTLCVVSTFAAEYEPKTVIAKFRKAFNESNDLQGLHLKEEDKKFYNTLRRLISSHETEALRSSLVDLSEQHSSSIEEVNQKVKNLNEQLSVVSKLLKSNEQLNEYSNMLLTSLDETVNFFKHRQFKPITFNGVFLRQNIQFYSELKSLGEKLHEISGNSSLGHNFVKTFKENGDFKLFEIRDQLIAKERSKRSAKKIMKKIGYWACKLLEFATKYSRFERTIADFIYKHVPEEYQTEFVNTLAFKGVLAVTNLARKMCGQEAIEEYLVLAQTEGFEGNNHALLTSRNIFAIYSDLFPKREVDFEFFKTFIHWYRLSLHNAFVAIQTDVDEMASQMKQEIRKVADEMSNTGNEILMVYSNDLKMDQFLKQSIRFRAIDLKNTLHF